VKAQPRPVRSIIADPQRYWIAVAALAAVVGALAAVHYANLGLTLSHYDAKGHLVVARRILDGINPGWVQVGAVWLPLPHLLNMLPVQIDYCYRTGFSGVVMSVVAFGLTAGILARLIGWATGSRLASLAGVMVFVLNPNILYLQSTPMTEPLLMLLVTGSIWTVIRALEWPSPERERTAGLMIAAACMTRYEAWPVTGALLVLAACARWFQGASRTDVVRQTARLAAYPAVAILGFLVLGRASTGAWFTTSGFFVPENIATGKPIKSVLSAWWGAHEMTSYGLASVGLAGLLAACAVGLRHRGRSLMVVLIAVAAAAALPAYAFFNGHPFRIRYMVPLIPAIAIGVGLFVGLARGRWRIVTAAVALLVIVTGPKPFDAAAPMVLEAQWDRPNRVARQAVASYLREHWDHDMVLASMGSLAHFMQELSGLGFNIRDFLHEGNGFIWDAAIENPGGHVSWILIEERAEGGDVLAVRARTRPGYLAGFARVAEGGGIALYRRVRSGT
jgi:hypothetical protein